MKYLVLALLVLLARQSSVGLFKHRISLQNHLHSRSSHKVHHKSKIVNYNNEDVIQLQLTSQSKKNSIGNKIKEQKNNSQLTAMQKLEAIDPDFQQFYQEDNSQKIRQQEAEDALKNVDYVQKISEFGQDQLQEFKKKKNSFLIGKSVYFEKNMTFDEAPQFFNNSQTVFTGVNIPVSDKTQEKLTLWNARNSPRDTSIDLASLYNNVFYKDPKGHINNADRFNTLLQVTPQQQVPIETTNLNSRHGDAIVQQMDNPIKYQVLNKQRERTLQIESNQNQNQNQKVAYDDLDKDLDSIV